MEISTPVHISYTLYIATPTSPSPLLLHILYLPAITPPPPPPPLDHSQLPIYITLIYSSMPPNPWSPFTPPPPPPSPPLPLPSPLKSPYILSSSLLAIILPISNSYLIYPTVSLAQMYSKLEVTSSLAIGLLVSVTRSQTCGA